MTSHVGRRRVAGLAAALSTAVLTVACVWTQHPTPRPPVPSEHLVVAPRPGLAWQVDQAYGTDDSLQVIGPYLVEVPRNPRGDRPVNSPPPLATLVVRDAATGRRLWATQDPVGLVFATRTAVYSVGTGQTLPANPGAAAITAYDLPTGRRLRLAAGLPTMNGVDPTNQYALGYAHQGVDTVLVAYDPLTGHRQWTANPGGSTCPVDAIASTLINDGPRVVMRLLCYVTNNDPDILSAIDAATGAVLWTDAVAPPPGQPSATHLPAHTQAVGFLTQLKDASGPTLAFDQFVPKTGPVLVSSTTGRTLPPIPLPMSDYSGPVLAPDGSVVIPQTVPDAPHGPDHTALTCWDPATNATRWSVALPPISNQIVVVAYHETSMLLVVDGHLHAFNMADGHPIAVGDGADIPLTAIGITHPWPGDNHIARYANLLIGPTGAIKLTS